MRKSKIMKAARDMNNTVNKQQDIGKGLTRTHKLVRSRKNTNIELKPYQKQILKELEDKEGIALFMKTGTGKTYTSLFKMLNIGVENILIQCPSRVARQWEDSVKDVFTDYEVVQFKKSWTGKKKEAYLNKIKPFKNSVIIIPYEIGFSMRSLPHLIDNTWGIIYDESHKLRNSQNKSTKMALRLSKKTKFKVILTATPVQGEFGGYEEYYNQLKLIDAIKMNKNTFKSKYMEFRYVDYPSVPFPVPELVGYKNTDELDGVLKSHSRSMELHYGEFEPIFNQVMIDAPKKLYRQVSENEELVIKSDGETITIPINSGMQRLHLKKMICSGVAKDPQGNYYNLNQNKLKWLEDFISDTEVDERVIVFYQYVAEKLQIEEMLNNKDIIYSVISGEQDAKEKIDAVKRKDTKVILGQLDSASESIDGLQHQSHIAVYYALPKSSITYRQSLGRIDRIGQTQTPYYIFLTAENTVDSETYQLMKDNVAYNEVTLSKLSI